MAVLALEAAAHRGLAIARAEAAYRAGLAIDPGSLPLRSELASVLLEAGRAGDAQQLIAAVLAEQPSYVPALLLRGSLETSSRQLAAAEATFQQAADLARGDPAQRPGYVVALARLVEAQLALDKVVRRPRTRTRSRSTCGAPRALHGGRRRASKNLDGAERRLEGVIADVPGIGRHTGYSARSTPRKDRPDRR